MTKLRAWKCVSVATAVALIVGVVAIAVPTVPALADGGTWDIQTVDDIDVMSTSLALDSNGYPHISYTTRDLRSLHYAHWTGTAWVKEMVDDVPAVVTSLALDSNDIPHISYTTFAIGDDSLHYARWTGTAWAKETVDESDVLDCSLALDSQNRPHISYATSGSPNSLHYARWTGTAWAKETVDDVPTIVTSIALDSYDRPHISYATGGRQSLHYARWTGTAWAKETVDASDVISTSIALDSQDRPHISYATGTGGASLHYAYWTGSGWSKEAVDPEEVSDCSLALDSQDRPHISYHVGGEFFDSVAGIGSANTVDSTITGKLKYAYWTGSSWIMETIDEETEEIVPLPAIAGQFDGRFGGKWSSIALDSYDLPHISYGNLVPHISTFSLHYAHLIPSDTATVQTATGTGTATFSTSAGGIAQLTAANSTPCGTIPSGISFPHGFFSFVITDIIPGSTVTITITLPSDIPTDTQYWKCINGQWVDATSILGSNNGDNILTLTITDGSQFDADGQPNGTIIDPGGPAIPILLQTKPRVSSHSAASLSVQYMNISPQQVYANQPVTISTNVANTGGEAGSLNVALNINGKVEQTKFVSVGPQGTQSVRFTAIKAQPGTYAVNIAGQTGSFTVIDSTASTEAGSGGLIAIIVIAVLVLAAVVVLLIVFRRT